jgi:hypothetical protein
MSTEIQAAIEEVIRVYRASDPEHPDVYRLGELAEAELALPDWSMPVDGFFRLINDSILSSAQKM